MGEEGRSFIIDGCNPIFYRRGEVGCLCIHGLTASTNEIQWLCQYLAERNITVFAPRLPGHGTSPSDLARMSWEDWYRTACDGLAILKQQCTQVFVAGMSLGGLLALELACNEDFDGLIAMATPLRFDEPLLKFVRILQFFIKYRKKSIDFELDKRVRKLQYENHEPILGRVAYSVIPLKSLTEVITLQNKLVLDLKHISIPALLVYSENDKTVSLENADLLAWAIGTQPKDIYKINLKRSGHILTQDIEMKLVFEAVADFISNNIVKE